MDSRMILRFILLAALVFVFVMMPAELWLKAVLVMMGAFLFWLFS